MYWATGSARVLAVEPSLLKLGSDGDDEELELVLPVITPEQDQDSETVESSSQSGIQSRIIKGTGSGIVDMARNEQGSLWATITRESIHLWVHRVMTCKYQLPWIGAASLDPNRYLEPSPTFHDSLSALSPK